jgi:alpha 1,3-glucosidase
VIAVDAAGSASGQIYIDDGRSYEYQQGSSSSVDFTYTNGVLKTIPTRVGFDTQATVERVVVLGITSQATRVYISTKTALTPVDLTFRQDGNTLTVRKPDVGILSDFSITIE